MTTTTNKGYTEPTVGGDVGTWGGELNADLVIIDSNLGGNLAKSITVADVTLSATEAQNLSYTLTGALTGNRNLIFPAAQGGFFKIYNNTTGTFTVTAKVSGGTGVIVQQGAQTAVWSDATNMYFDTSTQGRWINRQVITATQTYTATLGTNFVYVRIVGGGGGGGGAATTSAAQVAIGAGGGAGGYTEKRITAAFAGVTVTIGAAGTGAAAGANTGTAGGTSSFGGLLSAGGGSGGSGGPAAAVGGGASGGAGGSAAGGDFNIVGQQGNDSAYFSLSIGQTGAGGSNPLGFGTPLNTTNSSTGGFSATGFGAGGGGAACMASHTQQGGGNGTKGVCIIDEYL